MTLRYSAPTALEYFATLVQSDEHFPLLEAAACVAHDEYPELDVQQLLGDVDQLQARLRRRLAPDAASLQRLQVLNQFFYGDLGFGGNVNNYYDPENSYLNAVLRTRRGIPVSLAVLWMELAQGLGLQVRGVAFPGHFMVKALLPQGQAVLDPLTGQSLSREELLEAIEALNGFEHAPAQITVGEKSDTELLGCFMAVIHGVPADFTKNNPDICKAFYKKLPEVVFDDVTAEMEAQYLLTLRQEAEAAGDAPQVADAVAVGILEGTRVDLVDHRVRPPRIRGRAVRTDAVGKLGTIEISHESLLL